MLGKRGRFTQKKTKVSLFALLLFLTQVLMSFVSTMTFAENRTMANVNLNESIQKNAADLLLDSKQAPRIEKIPHTLNVHGEKLVDNYQWLRDPGWPKVTDSRILNYLTSENNYSDSFIKAHEGEYNKLNQELISRIKLEDSSVPVKINQYLYYQRTEKDSNYPIFARKLGEGSPEEIILDINQLAKSTPYFALGTLNLSNDDHYLLFSADNNGSDRYTIQVKDLKTGQVLKDSVPDSLGSVYWNKNGTGFFYTKVNAQWRSDEVYFHKLGDDSIKDKLLYKETDPLFMVHLDRSANKRFIFLTTESKNATEVRYIDLDQPSLEPKLIQERKEDHIYRVENHNDLFYILTNDKGKNFRLVTTAIMDPALKNWQEWLAHDPNVYLNEIALFKDYLALSTSIEGLTKLKIFDLNTKKSETIDFPEPTYDASIVETTFDAQGLRIKYSSLITPESIMEYNFTSKNLNTLKVQDILNGYDKSLYQTERLWAKSKDGTKIPISLVYKKSLFKKDGTNPLYLYGYGSYGAGVPVNFRHTILSLLDRGFVYAIAHIRGGDELGYEWYEKAKFLTKRNTFDDFIATADYLVKNNYTKSGNISITGRSAGGMLIGVAINERPELFKSAVADVPFVDVLNTMLDDTLPLTPGEFKEWGNPKDRQYFDYIKSYSPYDNIKAQAYPALYVSAGLNDPRVTYWEPAKWVAKLRELKTDNNLLLLHTNMDAGHAGASGRFETIKELSKEFLFILLIHGIAI